MPKYQITMIQELSEDEMNALNEEHGMFKEAFRQLSYITKELTSIHEASEISIKISTEKGFNTISIIEINKHNKEILNTDLIGENYDWGDDDE